MAGKNIIDADFVRVRNQPNDTGTEFHLYFGDKDIIDTGIYSFVVNCPDCAQIKAVGVLPDTIAKHIRL